MEFDQLSNKIIITNRDCGAILVPTGEHVTIPKESKVVIQKKLGINFTVLYDNRLARISGYDLDALGFDNNKKVINIGYASSDKDIMAVLKECYDPEIPVNIVDLGLIYQCDMQFLTADKESAVVNILLTLTAPGCAMGPVLIQDIENAVKQYSNVTEVVIDLTFDPPWSMESMTEAARLQLGLL